MRICAVEKNSVGEELGIKADDNLIAINGKKVIDTLDYEFYNEQKKFSLLIERNGEETIFDIKKGEDETLGFSFENEIEVKTCHNKCLFCFIDQLPKFETLRQTLKVKDDDYRHSFISGTYITLTNLTDGDIERIIRLKLSPLYISVHSTNDELRKKMLGIKNSRPILPLLKKLNKGGIDFHTQIVYCPTINDDLKKSIMELAPLALSLAIVPVGLTKYSNSDLTPVDKVSAAKVIEIVEQCQEFCLKKYGTKFVNVADEFYIKTGCNPPSAETYEGYGQIENGVGLLTKFNEDFDFALDEIIKQGNTSNQIGDISIVTGESAFEFIKNKAKVLTDKFSGKITVHKIKNDFFGNSVTVAGLITGGDICEQLKNVHLGERLLLPSVMFREFNETFLDNMTLRELEKILKVKAEIVGSDGESFVKAIVKRSEL